MTLDEERQAIRRELEALKARGAHRRELSLHACKRLFFDLGIRPSMAAVRDLTLTGSASDIPKDIDHFWEKIRETSKVRVGAGVIPPSLEERAGELLGALFEEALAEARRGLDAERAEVHAAVGEAEQRLCEAEIRRQAAEEVRARSEERADAAWSRVRELETELATAAARGSAGHEALLAAMARLEADNERLGRQLAHEQAASALLRERVDSLQAEMKQGAEHYAQQIKDAVADAERRVKPMLVELDSLRSMASTYQAGIRDASRKEFDFIQQLSAAKARADRLEAQTREQSDEIDALAREIESLRKREAVSPEIADVLCSLARAGRLGEHEFAALGTAVDGHIVLPGQCPKCTDGEPELAQVGEGYEVMCPECDHSSGVGRSRLEAITRFVNASGAASAV